ncbi:F0F1 ATP synthase subunit gamma [Egicoccus halophilus]|uniref:ATP synthase gamma chain n=1 Tax=Egicoccus halophilus TaxID=1670830 RepID=A0A8J3EWN4_9ACTN|nr:F0F1 ATP synthase subunit gamma [Egicoccus halophilus]GGI04041.1 ATP synthase gamma chain [Egicoccus halophilus]
MAGSGQIRQLRRRIRSVKSTQKITRAMEMIAASRILKAQRRVQEARPYAEQITEVIKGLALANEVRNHPLLRAPENPVGRVAVLVNTSDRGLAGAYNANVIKAAERTIRQEEAAGNTVELYVVGKKGIGYFSYRGRRAAASWEGVSDEPRLDAAAGIAEGLMNRYATGEVDRVWVVYTDFKSSMTQQPVRMELLPVKTEEFEGGEQIAPEIMFEPSPAELLDALIPRYVDAKVFHSLLESSASEHAARQRAMKSATDNAEEVAGKLSRVMNQARQDQITTEISEIVGGAEALGQAS